MALALPSLLQPPFIFHQTQFSLHYGTGGGEVLAECRRCLISKKGIMSGIFLTYEGTDAPYTIVEPVLVSPLRVVKDRF